MGCGCGVNVGSAGFLVGTEGTSPPQLGAGMPMKPSWGSACPCLCWLSHCLSRTGKDLGMESWLFSP